MTAKPIFSQGPVVIYELLGSGDEKRIEALLALYAQLFPQYAHYVPRMRNRAKYPNENARGHVVHYWLAEVDGQPAGLRTFRYLPQRRCGLAHALAVHPDFRKAMAGEQRLPIYIIYRCLDQVIADAKALGDPPALGMVNEVEYDRLMSHYERNGLIKLPVTYYEPVFSGKPTSTRQEELDEIEFMPMHLGFLPNPDLGEPELDPEILVDFTLGYLVDHYGLPEDHPVVQEILQNIPA